MSQNRARHPSSNQTVSQNGLYKNTCHAISDQDLVLNDLKLLSFFLEFKNEVQESNFIDSLYLKLEVDSGLFYLSRSQTHEKSLNLSLVWNYQGKNFKKSVIISFSQALDESFLDRIELETPPIPFVACESNTPMHREKNKCSFL